MRNLIVDSNRENQLPTVTCLLAASSWHPNSSILVNRCASSLLRASIGLAARNQAGKFTAFDRVT